MKDRIIGIIISLFCVVLFPLPVMAQSQNSARNDTTVVTNKADREYASSVQKAIKDIKDTLVSQEEELRELNTTPIIWLQIAILVVCIGLIIAVLFLYRLLPQREKEREKPQPEIPHKRIVRNTPEDKKPKSFDREKAVLEENKSLKEQVKGYEEEIEHLKSRYNELFSQKILSQEQPVQPSSSNFYYIEGIPAQREGAYKEINTGDSFYFRVNNLGELQLVDGLDVIQKEHLINSVGSTPLLEKEGQGRYLINVKPGKIELNEVNKRWSLTTPIVLVLNDEPKK